MIAPDAVEARRERRIALLVTLGLALGQWGSSLATGFHTGFGDWQMVHHHWEAAWVTVTRFGEMPLWDPFHCGGVPLLGNPEAQTYGPQFLLALLMGTTLAQKVLVILHAWFGFYWAFRWARSHHGLSILASYVASITWAASGYFAWQIGGGHATFLPFYFAPALLIALRASAFDARAAVAAAGLLALTVMEGGTYPFPYFVVMACFDGLLRLIPNRRGDASEVLERLGTRFGVLRGLVVVGVLSALMGAIRFLPIMDVLARYPRTIESSDSMQPYELLDLWGRWAFPWDHPLHEFVWPEYVAFISPPLLVLAILGVGVAINRRRYSALLGALFFIALLLGDHGPYSPWALLHRLPVYDSLRLPSRFSGLATLYVAALAGFGVDALLAGLERLQERYRELFRWPRAQRVIPLLLVVASTAWLFLWSQQVSDKWHDPPLSSDPPAESFHYAPAHLYGYLLASLPRLNQGTPMCYVGNMNWRVANGLWNGPRPQARVEGRRNRAGEVVEVVRTPNRFHATAQLIRPGRVVFNQNYDPDWQTNHGKVVDERGRLAVDLLEGEHKIIVRYAPRAFIPGLAGTGAGLLLAWLVFAYGFRRPARDALAV